MQISNPKIIKGTAIKRSHKRIKVPKLNSLLPKSVD